MGRPKSLERDRDVFVAVLSDGEQAWRGFAALPTTQQKTLAEDVFLRFIVGWDFFLSEWFIGAITLDARPFRSALQQKLAGWQKQVRERDSRYRHFFVTPQVTIRQRPRLADVRDLVDPSGRNVEFRSFEEFETRVRRELATQFVERVAAIRRAGGNEVVDAASAMRNVLAHRSDRSVKMMNEQLAGMPAFEELRKPRVSSQGVGASSPRPETPEMGVSHRGWLRPTGTRRLPRPFGPDSSGNGRRAMAETIAP